MIIEIISLALFATTTAVPPVIPNKLPKLPLIIEQAVLLPLETETITIKEYARRRIIDNWNASQWPAFEELIDRESTWKVGNVNPSSGACGLGQSFPCSKLGKGYGNALMELEWTISYVKERYGTPQEALAFHNEYNSY